MEVPTVIHGRAASTRRIDIRVDILEVSRVLEVNRISISVVRMGFKRTIHMIHSNMA